MSSIFMQEVHRKSVHLSSLWMVVALFLLSERQSQYLFGSVFFCVALFELLRRMNPTVKTLCHTTFRSIFRPEELTEHRPALTGGFFFTLAVFLAALLFPTPIAIISVLVMILSDTMAALVGKSVGRLKFMGKTVEGCFAFFATTLCIFYAINFYFQQDENLLLLCLASFILTLIELFSKRFHIDDNLSLVLATGGLLLLLPIIHSVF